MMDGEVVTDGRFEMADAAAGELFNAVGHVLRSHVGRLCFTARKRIAAAVFDTIIAAGEREIVALEARQREEAEGAGGLA